MKQNHTQMLIDIRDMVQTDFVAEMEMKRYFDKKFTQDEAGDMANLLSNIYFIAHKITCKACAKRK